MCFSHLRNNFGYSFRLNGFQTHSAHPSRFYYLHNVEAFTGYLTESVFVGVYEHGFACGAECVLNLYPAAAIVNTVLN